jgi:hypothetical protein
VRQHEGVVVDVDDAARRVHPLGDLVGVVDGRQAGADVEKLADVGLAREIPDRAREEIPESARLINDAWIDLAELVAGRTVDFVVVLAPEPVVPDPGCVRDGGVDPFHQVFLGFSPPE